MPVLYEMSREPGLWRTQGVVLESGVPVVVEAWGCPTAGPGLQGYQLPAGILSRVERALEHGTGGVVPEESTSASVPGPPARGIDCRRTAPAPTLGIRYWYLCHGLIAFFIRRCTVSEDRNSTGPGSTTLPAKPAWSSGHNPPLPGFRPRLSGGPRHCHPPYGACWPANGAAI